MTLPAGFALPADAGAAHPLHVVDKAGFAVIATAMRDCVADPDGVSRDEDITTEELEKLFMTLA